MVNYKHSITVGKVLAGEDLQLPANIYSWLEKSKLEVEQ